MPTGTVHTAKNGAKYILLANGKARFVKGGHIKKTKKTVHRKSKK